MVEIGGDGDRQRWRGTCKHVCPRVENDFNPSTKLTMEWDFFIDNRLQIPGCVGAVRWKIVHLQQCNGPIVSLTIL